MTIGVGANLLALAVLIGLVASRARPVTRALRMRNALLLQPAGKSDFRWIPPHFPPGFKAECRPPTAEFSDIVAQLGIASLHSDWDKALLLAAHLSEHALQEGEAIRADLLTTYRAIRRGHGYCADYVKVYLALAHAAGLTARQWAFSFDGFGGHGHTVVEVFDRQRGKWLLIDVHNNFHVVDVGNSAPLGVIEYRESLLGRRAAAVMRPNGSGRLGFIFEHKAIDYYLRGVHQWYLWWSNAVFSYDCHPLVRTADRISRSFGSLMATIVGVQPRIRILETPENVEDVRKMFVLRRLLLWSIALLIFLCCALAAQLLVGTGDRSASP